VGDGNGPAVIACYLRGTRIRTARDDVPVEFLFAGGLVERPNFGLQPVRWIRWRRYALEETEARRG
jgi:hypothetical protein